MVCWLADGVSLSSLSLSHTGAAAVWGRFARAPGPRLFPLGPAPFDPNLWLGESAGVELLLLVLAAVAVGRRYRRFFASKVIYVRYGWLEG